MTGRIARRVICLTLALALMVPGLAVYADTVVNSIDTTYDSALETITTEVGTSTSVGFFIRPQDGSDPVNGCNATGSSPATVTFSVPSAVTASRTELVFAGCGVEQQVSFSSVAPGSYGISVANVTGGKDGGTFDTGPASFTLVVTGPLDTTPPVITPTIDGTLGNNGWYTSDVTVSWSVVDNESAISSSSGCDPTTINADTAGTTLTCTATSAGGTSSESVTIKRDATAPVVTVTGVQNGKEYVLGSVPTAGCDTTDATSGVATAATLSLSEGNSNGVGQFTATCSGALDNAGNTGSASVTYSVIYDFNGFFRPVDMTKLNQAKAGSAIPIKFSLSGDQGLGIFSDGYPMSQQIACDGGALTNYTQDATVAAGHSSLSYDADADQYIYVWKTDKSWAGTCRQLVVTLNDLTEHKANFTFK